MKKLLCVLASVLILACSAFAFACSNGNVSGVYKYEEGTDYQLILYLEKDGTGTMVECDEGVMEVATRFTYKILEENKYVVMFDEGKANGDVFSYEIVGKILSLNGLAFKKQ